jgi:hypothetical protein
LGHHRQRAKQSKERRRVSSNPAPLLLTELERLSCDARRARAPLVASGEQISAGPTQGSNRTANAPKGSAKVWGHHCRGGCLMARELAPRVVAASEAELALPTQLAADRLGG